MLAADRVPDEYDLDVRRKPSIDGNKGYQCLNVILTAMGAAKAGTIKPIKH